jgi:hypothetical protein
MSLDVRLELDGGTKMSPRRAIFVREDGRTVEITPEEWHSRYPFANPFTVEVQGDYVFESNITHNLVDMAEAAGIYACLWCPEEVGIKKAKDLIPLLEAGLQKLKADPDKFRSLNPPNGWGSYEGLVAFVEEYLEACRRWPEATVHASG